MMLTLVSWMILGSEMGTPIVIKGVLTMFVVSDQVFFHFLLTSLASLHCADS